MNNFTHNTVSPSTNTTHLHICFLLLPLNKLKYCVTLKNKKKASQKPQIHVKPTTYSGKQCTDIRHKPGRAGIWLGNLTIVAPPTVPEIANRIESRPTSFIYTVVSIRLSHLKFLTFQIGPNGTSEKSRGPNFPIFNTCINQASLTLMACFLK
jgi:hypothetical protein